MYLVIPNIIFGIYLSNLALIISLLASIYLLWASCKTSTSDATQSHPQPNQFLLIFLAIAWVYGSGITGQIYSNSDWPVRFTVLNDLIISNWPVIYHHDNQSYFLRAPLGYYLPSAMIGRLFNDFSAGVWALFIWTVIGVYLTFSIALNNLRTRNALWGTVIIILFSGLDVIGYLLVHSGDIHIGAHLEWWNKWQYSSNTTLLFWAPNHAISAWVFTTLMLRKADDFRFWNTSPLLLAMTLCLSPLSFIGCFALYCLYFFKRILDSIIHNRVFQIASFLSVGLALLVSQYLLFEMKSLPIPIHKHHYSSSILAIAYIVFIFLEFGLLSICLNQLIKNKRWLHCSCVILITLPLLPELGPGNDLVMRGSIPALFCLCLLLLDGLQNQKAPYNILIMNLAISVFLVGSITAGFEIARPFLLQANEFIPKTNLYEFTEGGAKHYYAPFSNVYR